MSMGKGVGWAEMIRTGKPQLIDWRLVRPAEGNREVTQETVGALLESMREGQLVPGIVAKSGDGYVALDGTRRWYCCRELDRALLAYVLPEMPAPEEIARGRLVISLHFRKSDAACVAGDLFKLKQSGLGVCEIGELVGLKQSYVSKSLAPYTNGSEGLLRGLDDGSINPSSAYYIARLPKDRQPEAIARCAGRKRRFVEAYVKGLLAPRGAGRVKALKLEHKGCRLTVPEPTVERVEQFAAALLSAAKRAAKDSLPPDTLCDLMK